MFFRKKSSKKGGEMKKKSYLLIAIVLLVVVFATSCSNKNFLSKLIDNIFSKEETAVATTEEESKEDEEIGTYIGKWSFTNESIDDLVDLALTTAGLDISKATKKYISAVTKATYSSYKDTLYFDLREDGTCSYSLDGTGECLYYVDIDEGLYLLILIENEQQIPVGTFSSNFKKLSILSIEGVNLYKE